jgi:ubiquinone biosynthesis protein UbiJ
MINTLILRMLNHLLDQAEWARARLQPFAGCQAKFDMPPWQFAFSIDTAGCFAPVGASEIDVTVALPADVPLAVLKGSENALADAYVTGNAEFAAALSFVLKNLRWDAEEDLSHLVGDIAARRIVGAVSRLAAWQRRVARNCAEDIGAYLGEEARLLTPRRKLTAFRNELIDLTTRIDALAARVRN